MSPVTAEGFSICKGPTVQAPSSCYKHSPKDLVQLVICDPTSKKRKTHEVPRSLLAWHSAYFAAALDPQNNFTQSTDNNLTLDESHDVFEAFVCWLYTGRLKDPPVNSTEGSLTCKDTYLQSEVLLKIWIFADARGIPALGNAAIDMLHERMAFHWQLYGPGGIITVYNNTMPNSNLRKFTVDACTKAYSYKAFQNIATADQVHVEFMIDVMPALIRQGVNYRGIGPKSWAQFDRCQWHDHSGPGGKLRLESRK